MNTGKLKGLRILELIKRFIPLAIIIIFLLWAVVNQIFYSSTKKSVSDFNRLCTVIRPPEDIFTLAIQGDILWAGGKDGVYKLDIVSRKVVEKLKADIDLNYVRALIVDNSNTLWIGHEGGLTSYDGKSFKTITRENGLPDNRVSALMQDKKGRLWVGSWDGVTVIDGTNMKTLTTKDGLLDNMTNVIMEDSEGGIWLGSYVAPRGGVSLLKDGKWQYFNIENMLPHNNITSIIQAKDGAVWIGTGLFDRGGAARLVNKADKWVLAETITKKDGLAGEKVRSLFQSDKGQLWLGSEYDGLTIINKGKKTIVNMDSGISDNEVKSILQDKYGNIWLGTRNGITFIRWNTVNML